MLILISKSGLFKMVTLAPFCGKIKVGKDLFLKNIYLCTVLINRKRECAHEKSDA
jgi:hypothetical protein